MLILQYVRMMQASHHYFNLLYIYVFMVQILITLSCKSCNEMKVGLTFTLDQAKLLHFTFATDVIIFQFAEDISLFSIFSTAESLAVL